MTRVAVYAGTFDPLTNGHIDIITRGLALFDKVIVACAINIRKTPLFTLDERIGFINEAFPDGRVEADTFDGLLVEYAAEKGACAILRGVRGPEDVSYEMQMIHMNRELNPNVDTVLLTATPDTSFISSSLVKEVARFGGDITAFVPKQIAVELQRKFEE